MKAARLHRYGEMPVVEEIPRPQVAEPLDVVVRVGGSGLCRTDLHVIDGVFAYLSKPLPCVLGHETAGWVADVGSGVIDLKVGDPVIVHPNITCGFCEPCRRGDDQLCERFKFAGAMVDGGFAEYVLTSARSVVKLGVSVEPIDVAGLADGGLAAYRAVKFASRSLPPGSAAVVIGAGGLGHIAVQLLRAMTAARVIVVDRSAAALELAGSLGADVMVPADGIQVDAVRAATAGSGGNVVLDFVGNEATPADALAMVARAGTYLVVGYGGTLTVPLIDLVANEIAVRGSLIGTHQELVELAAMAEAGKVSVTTRRYPLGAITEAIDDLREGRILGRAIIVP